MALADLLAALSPSEASDAYWRIENHAVVQGELYEVAEPCAMVLVALLVEERPRHVRICALDLLFQILSGKPASLAGTPVDIVERCQRSAMEGLWTLVREAVLGERDAAWDVVELLGLDPDRLNRLRAEVEARRSALDARDLPAN